MATLLDIMSRACDLADMPLPDDDEEFVGRSTLIRWCVDGVSELHRIVTNGSHPLYYRTSDFTLAAPAYSKALPANFARLLKLTLNPDTPSRKRVRRLNFLEQENHGGGGFLQDDWCSDRWYTLVGVSDVGTWTVQFEPQENASGNYRLAYVPTPAALTTEASVVDPELAPYIEYPALCAGIRMAGKEESSEVVANLKELRNVMRKDLEDSLEPDEGGPATIVDVWEG